MSFGKWVKANSHWVGLAGTVFGVAGIAYAILTAPHASISYNAKAITLIDATRAGGALKVTDQTGNKITSNVYAIEVSVWNSGDVSLGNLSDRVREPLSISLSPDTAGIVEAVIQRTTLETSQIEASQQSPSRIQIKWTQFDPLDAFRILLIYTANEQAQFNVSGKFVNVSIIDRSADIELRNKDLIYTPITKIFKSDFKSDFLKSPITSSIIIICFIGNVVLFIPLMAAALYPSSMTDMNKAYIAIGVSLFTLLLLGVGIFSVIDNYFHQPPI